MLGERIIEGKGDAASWRGAMFFDTASVKLSKLNASTLMFEYEVAEDGSTSGGAYEWK